MRRSAKGENAKKKKKNNCTINNEIEGVNRIDSLGGQ
jgi:hypothetical protein